MQCSFIGEALTTHNLLLTRSDWQDKSKSDHYSVDGDGGSFRGVGVKSWLRRKWKKTLNPSESRLAGFEIKKKNSEQFDWTKTKE